MSRLLLLLWLLLLLLLLLSLLSLLLLLLLLLDGSIPTAEEEEEEERKRGKPNMLLFRPFAECVEGATRSGVGVVALTLSMVTLTEKTALPNTSSFRR